VARIDYFNDPDAPKANSIVPSVTAIVPTERGELLLVHKTDNDLWALPGGGMDVGESMSETVVREVKRRPGSMLRSPAWSGSIPTPTTSWPMTTARCASNA
jgi:NADH pyrophosphatase NudC (nudix superfamily)